MLSAHTWILYNGQFLQNFSVKYMAFNQSTLLQLNQSTYTCLLLDHLFSDLIVFIAHYYLL